MVSENSMRRAALDGPHPKMKHLALIFCGGALLAMAPNTGRAHAEARALAKTGRPGSRRRLTLVSVRFGKDGQVKNAKPCSACMELIHKYRVSTIVWTNEAGTMQTERV